ncbi:hypothetical protein HNR77_003825 [Paenibacillus sp. JGP012]|uniref:hypothetical protein n=1 Tax=Paenibacillus sp. JGP012 TaxID=2735914 RepID=UPI00160E1FD2|nr:hypothetical protein [Paenibacillus sp. JGP012]MBB6022726.1 hypothetical protein [Paenibacillus sp. JGP012]
MLARIGRGSEVVGSSGGVLMVMVSKYRNSGQSNPSDWPFILFTGYPLLSGQQNGKLLHTSSVVAICTGMPGSAQALLYIFR